MKPLFSIVCLFCLLPKIFAQTGSWSPFMKLYDDRDISVEISFKILKNGCEQTESVNSSRYKYRVKGEPKNNTYYLTWKMDYVDCNGNLYYRNNSLDIGNTSNNIKGTVNDFVIYPDDEEFTCKSLEIPYYEVKGSFYRLYGGGLKALPFSKDPESITGETDIYRGDQTILAVEGGALGVGAKWVWYATDCGGRSIGEGSSITVTPEETTTYFVRAESPKSITNCVKTKVSVNQLSLAPTAIIGDSKICKGETVNLKVFGGRLGLGAVWVWYEGECNNKEIGRGSSISVNPLTTTTYFVRAEGQFNKTECEQIKINVFEKSLPPKEASSSNVDCANQPITLSVLGGTLAKEAQWKWYKGYCGSGYLVGTGKTIEVVPLSPTIYYVRAEGGCNTTECTSLQINPYKISIAPNYISASEEKGNKIQLSLEGGELGKGAFFKWYKNECGIGRIMGKGNSIVVRPLKSTVYFARAEGDCNTTACISKLVNPLNKHSVSAVYNSSEKFLHVGIGVGLDIISFSTIADKVQSRVSAPFTKTTSKIDQSITGFGAKGDFVFHPFMKDFFSLGIITSGAVGTTIVALSGGKNQLTNSNKSEKYFYCRFDIGAELAAGYYKLKALLVYKSSIQTHQYSATANDGNYNNSFSFNKELRRETISIGMRVAPYSIDRVRYKRGFCFDFLYHFSRDYDWQWKNFNWTYNALSNFQSGAGMALWVQSVLKMQVDVSFNSYLANKTNDNSKVGLQFSLIYNRNSFY